MGDLIASNIWKYMCKFDNSIYNFFSNRFVELICIAIGQVDSLTNAHSMYISKNSKSSHM